MRTVSYKSVIERISDLHGQELTDALATDVRKWCRWVHEALESAWYATLLTENTALEQRYYYDGLWSAKGYDADTRVWHAATEKWYDASESVLSTDVPGTSEKWVAVPTDDSEQVFARKLLVNDGVNTVIPECVESWAKDPRVYPTEPTLPKPLTFDGAHWYGASAPVHAVWVKYRQPLPAVVAYDATLTWADETLPAVYERYIVWYVRSISYMDAGQLDRMGQAERMAGAALDVQILNQLKGRPNRPLKRKGYGA